MNTSLKNLPPKQGDKVWQAIGGATIRHEMTRNDCNL